MTQKSATSSLTNYRAAVIGCGRIGCGFMLDPLRGRASTHAGAYAAAVGIDLVALCDCQEGLAQRYADELGVQAYIDYHEMLASEGLDIVSVCTPPETHEEIVRNVAHHGVGAIFCEKPISTSLVAAEYMVRVCAEQNVLLMIGHQRRFDPMHRQLRAFIEKGGLGNIQQATCYYTAGVANTGSHLFDLLRFYLGEMMVVRSARLSPNSSHNPNDPNIDAEMEFEKAPSVVVQACDHKAYALFEITLLGTEGRLCIRPTPLYEAARPCKQFAGYLALEWAALPIIGKESKAAILLGAQHLAHCLATGQQPVSSGEDGLAALRIITELRRKIA